MGEEQETISILAVRARTLRRLLNGTIADQERLIATLLTNDAALHEEMERLRRDVRRWITGKNDDV